MCGSCCGCEPAGRGALLKCSLKCIPEAPSTSSAGPSLCTCLAGLLMQVGKLAAEVLLSGGRGERVTATPERLEGISLTV